MARLILEQICEDTRTYMRRVISCECALVDMVPKELTRSKSLPNLEQNSSPPRFPQFRTELVPIRIPKFKNIIEIKKENSI